MPWKCYNDRSYYYRQRKVGGRVVSEYVGGGEAGRAAAEVDATIGRTRALEREAERARLDRVVAGIEAVDREAAGLSAAVDAVVVMVLETAGFHRHKRTWRRRRRTMNEVATRAADAGRPYTGRPPMTALPPGDREELREVLNRAAKGDKSALPRVREFYAVDPERMTFIFGGWASRLAEDRIVGFLAGPENLAAREALELKLDLLRAELAGPHPSPIERLLAERIAFLWLDAAYRDSCYTRKEEAGMSFREAEHYDRARHRANARYIGAIKALATVRKLGVAQIQVAIGKVEVGIPATAAAIDASEPPGG